MTQQDQQLTVGALEAESAARLRVLLGVLAEEERARHMLPVLRDELDERTRWYRARMGLVRRHEFSAFLDFAGLTPSDFRAQMHTLCAVAKVGGLRRAEVSARMPRYRGVFSARDWLLRRELRREGL